MGFIDVKVIGLSWNDRKLFGLRNLDWKIYINWSMNFLIHCEKSHQLNQIWKYLDPNECTQSLFVSPQVRREQIYLWGQQWATVTCGSGLMRACPTLSDEMFTSEICCSARAHTRAHTRYCLILSCTCCCIIWKNLNQCVLNSKQSLFGLTV